MLPFCPSELHLMFSLMDKVPSGIEPMLKDLEEHIMSAGLADMVASAETITSVSAAHRPFTLFSCAFLLFHCSMLLFRSLHSNTGHVNVFHSHTSKLAVFYWLTYQTPFLLNWYCPLTGFCGNVDHFIFRTLRNTWSSSSPYLTASVDWSKRPFRTIHASWQQETKWAFNNMSTSDRVIVC